MTKHIGPQLTLDAATARRLLLVQAIETADTQGKLLSVIEREQIEREAVEACKAQAERDAAAGRSPDAIRYLDERARRMLAAVDNRDPRTAALQHADPWQHVLAWGLPLLALAMGAMLERIDNPRQVNMLSPPLLAFLAWNLVVYLFLLTRLVWPGARLAQGPVGALRRWLAQPGILRRGSVRLRVAAQLRLQWWRVAGALESLRLQQVFHASAAAWAVGVALSIVMGGLVREYRVGWESTLLDLPQVHALLRTLFAPVVALLPLEGFSLASLERMHFRSGVDVDRAEAQHWIALYLSLLGLVVIVPRALLALYARLRRGWLGRAVKLDLNDPYFTDLLARVSPAFVTLAWGASDGAARRTLQRVWREAAGSQHDRFSAAMDEPDATSRWGGGASSDAWTLLQTQHGDELNLVELNLRALAAGHGADAPASSPPGTPAGPAGVTPLAGPRRWLSLMRVASPAGWFGTGHSAPGDATPQVKADLVVLALDSPAQLSALAGWLRTVAEPVLALNAGDPAQAHALRAMAESAGLKLEVFNLRTVAGAWLHEEGLRQAIAARLPPHMAPGSARLMRAWSDRHEARLGASMQLLAGPLLQAATESEEAACGPLSLRSMVSQSDRDASLTARHEAMTAVLRRVAEAQARAVAQLGRLHGAPSDAAVVAHRANEGFRVRQAVDAPQAGMAGAASGAAAGATVDLMTGGLTLGAAAALGALVGGGAAFVAAAWRNRTAPQGATVVQPGDELLQALCESALLQYLSVAWRELDERVQASWRSEVVAVVEAHSSELAALWERARQAADAQALRPALAAQLTVMAREVLKRIRPTASA